MNSNSKKTSALLGLAAIVFVSSGAGAQGLNNSAWSPQDSNRASIAALIKQVEDGNGSASSFIGTGGGDVTQLICGSSTGEGTGASGTAQANSSCIILNNSNGALNIDQISDGDQNASADNAVSTTVDETINNAEGVDEVLATLAGR